MTLDQHGTLNPDPVALVWMRNRWGIYADTDRHTFRIHLDINGDIGWSLYVNGLRESTHRTRKAAKVAAREYEDRDL